jgi:hypothetical protein
VLIAFFNAIFIEKAGIKLLQIFYKVVLAPGIATLKKSISEYAKIISTTLLRVIYIRFQSL